MPLLGPGWTLSHGSAAVLRGLPVWPEALTHVHVTRPRAGGGRRRTTVRRHGCTLDPVEIGEVDGWPATDLARTVVDLARSMPFEQGVAAADRALALGATVLEDSRRRWSGPEGCADRVARRVVAFADGRSE